MVFLATKQTKTKQKQNKQANKQTNKQTNKNQANKEIYFWTDQTKQMIGWTIISVNCFFYHTLTPSSPLYLIMIRNTSPCTNIYTIHYSSE